MFSQYPIQKIVYHAIKVKFKLSAQAVIRAISKVADAYKLDKKVKRVFRKHGVMTYDARILSYNFKKKIASIWTIEGRMKIPFVCGEHQAKLLSYQRGESDLVVAKSGFYLLATCDIEDPPEKDVDGFIGIDLGIVNIATDSTGEYFSGEVIEKNRQRLQRLRGKLQSKGTKGCKRKLKRLSGKQKRFQKHTNHCIAKRIIEKAKDTGRAIAIENLKGIRRTATVRKSQRARHSNWAFYQLKLFIAYKAKLAGIPVMEVNPRNTSKSCSKCGHCEKSNRTSQSEFVCKSCGHSINADLNAAINIASRAAVSQPIFGGVVSCAD
jgi:IS605 OrfB family transposase